MSHPESLENRALMAVSYAYDALSETLDVTMTDSDNSIAFEFNTYGADSDDDGTNDAFGIVGRMYISGAPETARFALSKINVTVANPSVASGNISSFGLAPDAIAFDLSSFVLEGNGITASGFFQSKAQDGLLYNVGINLTNVDSISLTRAEEIRVDGTFSNNTGDAKVSIAPELNDAETQVFVGTNRPLVADYIQIEDTKSLSIFNNISASQEVILRSASKLDLPYDIAAGSRLVLDGTDGVFQRISSTMTAPVLEVINRAGTGGEGEIELGSPGNDFDDVRIQSLTDGKIGLRDIDDVEIDGYGILATTGDVVIDAGGALVFNSQVKADSLTVRSNHSIRSTAQGSLTIGTGGLSLAAAMTADEDTLPTGDILLEGNVSIVGDKTSANILRASGTTTLAGGLTSLGESKTWIESDGGIVISSPVQVGGSNLTLVSSAGGITILDTPGNEAVPHTIRAAGILALDAADDIAIGGRLYAGEVSVQGDARVTIGATGVLVTDATSGSGTITIAGASQLLHEGQINAADSAEISIIGDAILLGGVTTKTDLDVITSEGSIDVQGRLTTTGATGADGILLRSVMGSISTSADGVLNAGAGQLVIESQQNIEIGAVIDTQGGVSATTKLGAFSLDALLRTGTDGINIDAAAGISELEFGRVETGLLVAVNRTSGDITLLATDNRIVTLTAENLAESGAVNVRNNAALTVAKASALGDVAITGSSTLTVGNLTAGNEISIVGEKGVTIENDVDAVGDIVVTAASGLVDSAQSSKQITSREGAITVSARTAFLGPMTAEQAISVDAQAAIVVSAVTSQAGGFSVVSRADSISLSGAIVAESVAGSAQREFAVLAPVTARTGDVTIVANDGAVALQADVIAVKGDIDLTGRAILQGGLGVDKVVINDVEDEEGNILGQKAGEGYSAATTKVVIAAPRRGGTAAQAVPIVGKVQVDTKTQSTTDADGNTVTIEVPVFADSGIVQLILTSPGSGYEIGEPVTVNFIDPNVEAVASATVTLQSVVPNAALVADSGEVRLNATTEALSVQTIKAGSSVALTAHKAVTVTDSVVSGGAISLTTPTGGVTAQDLLATTGITIAGFEDARLSRQLYAKTGDIDIRSTAGSVAMTANAMAEDGAFRIVAHRHVEQSLIGIERVVVTNVGSGYTSANVTISPPSSGSGTAATARAILSPIDPETGKGGAVLAIELVTVGEGYAAGETVSVLIEGAGGTGAAAYAVASNVTSSIAAETGVFLNAGEDMRLVGVVRAEAGDIELRSKSGDLALDHPSLLIQAIDGGVVLAAAAGTINSGLVIADSDISIKSDAGSVFLNRGLASLQGGIDVEALGAITQSSDSGLAELLLVARGSASGSPNVTVTIGAPSSGGRAAKAVAILARDGNGDYFIERLELIERGSGYSVGERPIVEIAGIAGAAAQAIGPSGSERIVAETDITLKAGSSLLLTNRMLSARGDIAISSAQGNIDMTSDGGAVAQAVLGEVTIEAVAGQVTAQDVLAGTGILLRSLGSLSVAKNITSEQGDIRVESTAESVTLTANVHAKDGSLTVVSRQGVNQESDSGIRELVLIAGGRIEGLAPPRVRVLIAPPASGGGRPATAVAVIGRREVLRTDDDGGTETVIEYFVERLVVTDRGEGYAIGEAPAVTIDGGDLTGAAATAIGPTDLQLLKAKNDVTIAAQTDVTLRNLTVAETGSLTVTSDHGGLLLGGGAVVLSAAAGMVTLRSDERSVVVNRIIAGGEVVVDALLDASLLGDLTASGASPTLITARTGQAIATDVIVEGDLTISGHMGVSLRVITESRTGDVTVASNAGGVEVRSSVLAPQGRIEITAFDRFTQQSGTGIVGLTVLSEGALRSTNAPEVSVDIAAPRNGGVAARARAVLRRILIDDSDFDELANYEYSLDEVVLTDPGSGYEIGEAPDVTVNGLPGGVVLAVPRASSQIIAANDDIVIRAGDSVTLANRIQSDAGDIVIESLSGQIDAEENENPIDARAGALKIDARNGRASVSNVFAQEGITVSALETLTLGGNVVARGGDVVVRSTGSSVLLRANVDAAAGDIDIVARSTVSQIGGTGLTRIEVTSGGRLTKERGAGDPIDPPSTPTVTVAPPRNGGAAARATVQVSVTSVGVENDSVIDRIIDTFTVVAIVLDDPGSGYEVGESPLVTISGEIPGVAARAVGPLALPRVTAAKNLSVQGGDDVTLTSTFQAETGDIVITSVDGDLSLRDGFLAHAIAGDVALQAAVGVVDVQRVRSGGDTLIAGAQGVTIATDLDVEGDINISARAGAVNSRQLVAGGAISLTSLALIDINDEVLARTGDITVQSTSGGVFLGANVHAAESGIRISALGGSGTITQRDSSGIPGIDVVNAGSEISASPTAPTVTVEIAAPAGGGVAATGRAEIGRREISPDSPDGALSYEFFVRSIELTSSGSGYVSGENPTVTITGIANATARVRPIVGRAIVANTDLIAEAAADVTLRSTWRSNIGEVRIASVSGNLDLSADTFLAHAAAGGVTLTSSAGAVTVQQVTADDAVVISGATGVAIEGRVDSVTGGVLVTSTAGGLLTNDIYAELDITLSIAEQVTLLGVLESDAGDIEVTSLKRDLDLTASGARIAVDAGSATLTAINGSVLTPPVLQAAGDVTIRGLTTIGLRNEVTSATGTITVESVSGGIELTGNLNAVAGAIDLVAHGAVTQSVGGVSYVEVLTGGTGYDASATVTIAAPASGGGRAATGRLVLGTVGGATGVIIGITVVDPGVGYAVGEIPTVTIAGAGTGATARAVVVSGPQNIVAGTDVTVAAGTDVLLVNTVTANNGDIAIASTSGDIVTGRINSVAGGATLAANVGTVTGTAIRAASDIVVTAESVLIDTVVSSAGGVDVTGATSFTLVQGKGDVNVAGDFVATTVGSTLGNVTVLGARSLSSVFAGQVADVSGVSIGSVEAGTDAIVRGTAKVGSVTAGQDATVTAPTVSNVSAGLDAKVSGADVRNVEAVRDVSIRNTGDMTASGLVRSETGDVSILSDAGSVTLWARVVAEIGMVTVEAQTGVTQVESTGLTSIDVVLAGSVTGTPPVVTVTVAAPKSGGQAATAQAILQTSLDANGNTVYSLERIVLIDRGAGYAAGESPAVTITGLPGAAAVAAGPLAAQSLWAGNGILVAAGEDVALTRPMTATGGDIDIISTTGNLVLNADTFFAHAMAGRVTLTSDCGSVVVERVCAQDDVTITGPQGVTVEDEIRSDSGSVTMTADAGPATVQDIYAFDRISLTTAQDIRVLGLVQADQDLIRLESSSGLIEMVGNSKLHAKAGGIDIDAYGGSVELQTLSGFKDVTVNAAEAIDVVRSVVSRGGSIEIVSANNAVNVRQLNAKQDVTVSGFKTSSLAGEIVATKGDVNATSTAGGLRLNANILAGDDITLEAHTFIDQLNRTCIEALQIISEGSDRQVALEPVPPTVTVTVAAPTAGGRAATARAILGRRFLGNDPGGTIPTYEYFIDKVEIIDAGAGYAIGESPIVTITGMPGAVVRGIGPTNLRNITAGDNLTIHADDDMTLLYRLTATKGDLSISSVSGDIDLGSKLLRMTVPGANGDVSITTESGSIILPPVINIAGDITLRSFAPLTIGQQLTTSGGDVRLTSTAGSLAVNANVFAADRIELSSKLGITQNGGFMKAAELKATNMNTAGITLGSQGNDVDRFAATNVGDVSYTDADDFRVGLQTSGTMGVEVTGNLVSLSSVAPDSIIRVVAGMNYRRLNIAAGTLGGDDVGMVEFVVTSPLDSTSKTFSGRLRDMITYVSDNRANYLDDGATLPQPMTVVFDEPGYVISEIQVSSALPGFRRPVLFDGGRVADSVASGRLGIRGSATAPTGITLAAGSGGSTIRETALYGFSKGSAAVLESPRNTVIDTYFGIQADGVTTSANLVGVNLSGSLSRLNTIGSKTFSEDTVNKFAANTDAGILIQQGAFGNLVVGNEIGIAGLAKNRDGVRIDGSNGNRIGSEEQLTPDLSPIFSNRITNNARHGVSIVNTQGTGVPDANRVQNNFVGDNAGHGVSVQTGTNVVIGGESRFHANVFAKNAGSGVYLGSATRVNVVGNHIGVDSEATKAMGNGRMGVEVAVGSGSVRIEKNRISANTTNGVGITSRTSGVVITDNVIGGLLEDGTAAGNKFDGVLILNANGNIVGKGNLISQNLRSGVNVTSADAANLAAGNRIFGSEIIHNEQHGVRITGSNRVTVGGATEDLGNLIYGNKQDGVRIERHPTARTPATGNVIVNNFIGTNEFADVAADTENTGFDNDPIFNNGFGYPVPLGNANGIVIVQGNANQVRGNTIMNNKNGIEVLGGNGNVIGGATETFANSISHNTGDGILITDRAPGIGAPAATNNVTVSGNAITNNGGDGIEVVGSKVAVVTIGQNVTGQTVAGLPNTIQENAGNAVVVDGGQRVSLNGNAIAGEIVVQNGANAGSAAPMALGSTIDVVRRSNSQLVIKGTITGPSTARYERYLIDVFHKDPFDPSAMRTFLGRQTVVTDENGRATFEFTINASIEVGDEICLTATSLVYQPGATSMLGDCTVHALPGASPDSGTQGPRPPTRVPNP